MILNPDKLYIGTFERSSRFDAHLDKTGISLGLQRTREVEQRKSIRMHFHYALFAEILQDLAKTVSQMPPADAEHRNVSREGARALYRALGAGGDDDRSKKRGAPEIAADPSQMTPDEEGGPPAPHHGVIPGWFVPRISPASTGNIYNQLMAWPRRRAQPPPLYFFSVKMSQDELQAIVLFDTVVA